MDVTSFNWWHRITLKHTTGEKGRECTGAETRKSDELKMEWGLNKRPDGLSENVAVRGRKRRGQVGTARLGERKSSNPFQTVEAGSGERKSMRRKEKQCWCGAEGEVGQEWERQEGVCSHEPVFPPAYVPQSLRFFRPENRKVVVKSESAPAATRHTATHGDRFLLSLFL